MGTRSTWKEQLESLTRDQHGVIERRQVNALAPTESAARHELRSHRWECVEPGLHRLKGAPQSDHQQLMISVLDAGGSAVVSHHTAAKMWGVPGEQLLPVHVTRIRNATRKRTGTVVVHQARRLAADQVTSLDGVPVTRPERVPFDLANVGVPAQRIERIVDRLWSDRLVSGPSLRRVKKSLPRRGFRGTALMRRILEDRGDDWLPPASGLEARAMHLLEQNGFVGYGRQADLGGDEWVGRVDFVNLLKRVVVEVQSDRHHAALSSRRDDALRFERLEAAGFVVVTVWEDELWHRPGPWLERMALADSRSST